MSDSQVGSGTDEIRRPDRRVPYGPKQGEQPRAKSRSEHADADAAIAVRLVRIKAAIPFARAGELTHRYRRLLHRRDGTR